MSQQQQKKEEDKQKQENINLGIYDVENPEPNHSTTTTEESDSESFFLNSEVDKNSHLFKMMILQQEVRIIPLLRHLLSFPIVLQKLQRVSL